MNAIDRGVLLAVNHFAQRSTTFDHLVVEVSHSDALKGGVVLAIFWWAWFRRGESARRTHAVLLSGLMGGFVALVVGRVLAAALPFRVRPLHNVGLGFVRPFGMTDELRLWSSFPSDHAMLFTALAVAILAVSRRAGAALLAWTALVICAPRIYVGLHYPSDIVVGAAIGAAIGMASQGVLVRDRIAAPILKWRDRRPGLFYSIMFTASFQIATLFNDVRALLQIAAIALHRHG